jgi:hypothetical protein
VLFFEGTHSTYCLLDSPDLWERVSERRKVVESGCTVCAEGNFMRGNYGSPIAAEKGLEAHLPFPSSTDAVLEKN